MSNHLSSTHALGHAPWHLRESRPDATRAALHETLFTLGNGRIGLRGAHEEGRCWPGTEQDAVYINGFYDTEEIHYAENAFGLARHNQFMVNVPNAKAVQWWIDDEPFDPQAGCIEDYHRRLDFSTGVLLREFVWVSPLGRRVAVASRRMVSFERQAIYALTYELRPLDRPARIRIESILEATGHTLEASDDPRIGSSHAANALEPVAIRRSQGQIVLTHQTRHSGLFVASGLQTVLHCDAPGDLQTEDSGTAARPGHRFALTLATGERLRLEKYCALATSRDLPASSLALHASTQLALASEAGFEALCAEQQAFLTRYWQDSDIEIDGDDALQQGLRFNQLHLLQSAGRDGRTNIAAKGVTGSGYDGHYFWDTEIYVFPVMLHTQPGIARKLLEFRFHTLDAARARARELSHRQGALFPWRTIAGEECSSYFLAGTAQFHINADIAFAVKRYWEATGDDEFMRTQGAELVFETARIWLDLGHFETSPVGTAGGRADLRFCIHGVTGPDEYTALVNNNLYTNAMAQMHLAFAADTAAWLGTEDPGRLAQLGAAIALAPDEPAQWRAAAQQMYLPYDPARGIHPQDDSFLSKPHWDFANADPAKTPLLLHYHPLVIYRHQVCKQADVLLALLLLGDRFEAADKKRDFDYYEQLTTHDSSLSRCIFGIVAAEVGYHDKAYRYFADGARADLDDHHHNTRHGVHTAAMAGAWLGVVAGFAGLRTRQGLPCFNPSLPAAWQRYSFKLRFGDAQLQVSVSAAQCTYSLLAGAGLSFAHAGQPVHLSAGHPEVRLALDAVPPAPAVPASTASTASTASIASLLETS